MSLSSPRPSPGTQPAPVQEPALPPLAAARVFWDHILVAEIATGPQPAIAAQSGAGTPIIVTRSELHGVERRDGVVSFADVDTTRPGHSPRWFGRGALLIEPDGSRRLRVVTSSVPGEMRDLCLDAQASPGVGYCSFISPLHCISAAGDCLATVSMPGFHVNFYSIVPTATGLRLSAASPVPVDGAPDILAVHPASTFAAVGFKRGAGPNIAHALQLINLDTWAAADHVLPAAMTAAAFHPQLPSLFIGDAEGRYRLTGVKGLALNAAIDGRIGSDPITAAKASPGGFHFGTASGQIWFLELNPPDSRRHALRQVGEFPGQSIFDLQPVGGEHLVVTFANGGAVVLRRERSAPPRSILPIRPK